MACRVEFFAPTYPGTATDRRASPAQLPLPRAFVLGFGIAPTPGLPIPYPAAPACLYTTSDKPVDRTIRRYGEVARHIAINRINGKKVGWALTQAPMVWSHR